MYSGEISYYIYTNIIFEIEFHTLEFHTTYEYIQVPKNTL